MKYTKEELKILKEVISDYEIIKNDINEKIEKGYTLQDLLDYVRHFNSCNITNYDFYDDTIRYVDFNYCDMLLSIYDEVNVGTYLGDTIEVYNNIGLIDVFNNIDEIKCILKECE